MGVRVIAPNGTRIVLFPDALDSLLSGKFTESRPNTVPGQTLTMHPLTTEQVPSALLQAIRVFHPYHVGR